mgnify:FL=1
MSSRKRNEQNNADSFYVNMYFTGLHPCSLLRESKKKTRQQHIFTLAPERFQRAPSLDAPLQ